MRTRDVSGKGSRNVSAEVFGRLPRGPVQVFLDRREGRCRIRIIQQPSSVTTAGAALATTAGTYSEAARAILTALALTVLIAVTGRTETGSRGFV